MVEIVCSPASKITSAWAMRRRRFGVRRPGAAFQSDKAAASRRNPKRYAQHQGFSCVSGCATAREELFRKYPGTARVQRLEVLTRALVSGVTNRCGGSSPAFVARSKPGASSSSLCTSPCVEGPKARPIRTGGARASYLVVCRFLCRANKPWWSSEPGALPQAGMERAFGAQSCTSMPMSPYKAGALTSGLKPGLANRSAFSCVTVCATAHEELL